MAKKIIKGVLGIGKKKASPAAVEPAEQRGPIVKQLGAAESTLAQRKRRPLAGLQGQLGTILSDKLGA
ncbi:MAG: hypothetical protein JW741_12765 [Sedimentisphaerales bacterium]|nr:hypothetical protein [Sedimentisphaerales bacterium]